MQTASAQTNLFQHSIVLNCKMANTQDNQEQIVGSALVCYTGEKPQSQPTFSTSFEQLSFSLVDWMPAAIWSHKG